MLGAIITSFITIYFVFQQGSAPVHLAFNTVQLLQYKTLSFVSRELFPNNSPELN